ncbi:MAG: hypothetical protein KatS3mg002_0104 [Candidatus Woesearchaeota archaeon]|nr:MAG: hypothetical protein KatS3mg002_0104 [Candidatus Woesearchaeota archaeon]
MDEAIENAVEELKRIDHSIFVSLKYTRTVDILENILIRMVDCYEYLFVALLKYAKEHKMISEIPSTPKEKVTLIKEVFKEQEIHDNIDLYLLLKAMLKANFTRENEYRRHVAMRAIIAGREEIININIISRYYELLISFFHLVDNLRRGTYVIGTGPLVEEHHESDEENPNNPYWAEIRKMKEEAEAEIARDKEMRERIRLEKQQKELQRQADLKRTIEKNQEKKLKRITKRKPKIKPKRVITKEKEKYLLLKKKSKSKKKIKK